MDAFTAQALEMITSNKARDAFDVSKEPEQRARERTARAPSTCRPGGWSRRACRW